MKTLLRRRRRARPIWAVALIVALALHCVCIVCLAAAAEAQEARAAAETGAAAPATPAAQGDQDPADHPAGCDASQLMANPFGPPGTDTGGKAPGDHRTGSTAVMLFLLFSVALGGALWTAPRFRRPPPARAPAHIWRPSGFRLLTTLCIQRV
ncbi:hypothetical protein [Nocardiopsis composta]|uniref:Membrane-associated phospholipid phosphatase n=1 Tax=Nocardiopsis composta TaxID=157465 RepID=A0A7W8QNH2_9ACTN|nr:hypothetical protein [Nocardiopsis composta]MBB5433625.1 membrane-associated phospholipid phosphatase [Nocardiopsis composta]